MMSYLKTQGVQSQECHRREVASRLYHSKAVIAAPPYDQVVSLYLEVAHSPPQDLIQVVEAIAVLYDGD